MSRVTRALVIAPQHHIGATRRNPLSKLNAFGVACLYTALNTDKAIRYIDSLPDVIIIDATDPAANTELANICTRLKKDPVLSNLPVLVAGERSVFKNFDADGYLDLKQRGHLLAKKIKKFVRISAVNTEFARRCKTAEDFGILVGDALKRPQPTNDEARIKISYRGTPTRFFELSRLFAGEAALSFLKPCGETAFPPVEQDYDCLVIDTFEQPEAIIESAFLRQRASYAGEPVIVLDEGLEEDEEFDLIEEGSCDLFSLTDEAPDFMAHVKSLVQANRRYRALLEKLKGHTLSAIIDQGTGLPARRFFKAHLARLLHQSADWNVPVALGVIKFAETDGVDETTRREFEQVKKVIGKTLHMLLRTEDIATEWQDGKFVVAVPNSDGLAMAALLARISGILSSTAFSAETGSISPEIRHTYYVASAGDQWPEISERLNNA